MLLPPVSFYNHLNACTFNTIVIFKIEHIDKKAYKIGIVKTLCWKLIKPHIEFKSAGLYHQLNSLENVLLQKLLQKPE